MLSVLFTPSTVSPLPCGLYAHKMHHYLHDTTPFDLIYGSGMNEEFFWILAEIVLCLLCPYVFGTAFVFPYCLTWTPCTFRGKTGATRTQGGQGAFGDYDWENFAPTITRTTRQTTARLRTDDRLLLWHAGPPDDRRMGQGVHAHLG